MNEVKAMDLKQTALFQIVTAIEENPEISQRQLAKKMGISLGKTNFLINALLEKGLVKAERFCNSENKFKKVMYVLTQEAISFRLELTKEYLEKKRLEYEALKHEIDFLEKRI
jgi:EPS-associated MarR family transcriptional regulator